MQRQNQNTDRRIIELAKEAGLESDQAYLFKDCMDRFKGLGLSFNESVWATCQVVMLDKLNIIIKSYK